MMIKMQYIKLLELRGITELEKGQSIQAAVDSSGGNPGQAEMVKVNEAVYLYYMAENRTLEAKVKVLDSANDMLKKSISTLQKDSNKLTALENGGVDNWSWYGEALSVLCDDCGEFKEDETLDYCNECAEKA